LIGEPEEGLLDLSDAHVVDNNTGDSSRPAVKGNLPPHPMRFHQVPWYSEYLGNVLEDLPAEQWVSGGLQRRQSPFSCVCLLDFYPRHTLSALFSAHTIHLLSPPQIFKMYLIPVKSVEPFELDLGAVWVLDNNTRSIVEGEVFVLAPPETDPQDLRLRIR
jgi:hypothetical protein